MYGVLESNPHLRGLSRCELLHNSKLQEHIRLGVVFLNVWQIVDVGWTRTPEYRVGSRETWVLHVFKNSSAVDLK